MVVTSHPASGSLYFSSKITSSPSFPNTLSRPDSYQYREGVISSAYLTHMLLRISIRALLLRALIKHFSGILHILLFYLRVNFIID